MVGLPGVVLFTNELFSFVDFGCHTYGNVNDFFVTGKQSISSVRIVRVFLFVLSNTVYCRKCRTPRIRSECCIFEAIDPRFF